MPLPWFYSSATACALSKETSSLQPASAMQLCSTQPDLIFPVCSVCNSLCCAHAHFLHFSFRQRVNGQRFALLSLRRAVCGFCTCTWTCSSVAQLSTWHCECKKSEIFAIIGTFYVAVVIRRKNLIIKISSLRNAIEVFYHIFIKWNWWTWSDNNLNMQGNHIII